MSRLWVPKQLIVELTRVPKGKSSTENDLIVRKPKGTTEKTPSHSALLFLLTPTMQRLLCGSVSIFWDFGDIL